MSQTNPATPALTTNQVSPRRLTDHHLRSSTRLQKRHRSPAERRRSRNTRCRQTHPNPFQPTAIEANCAMRNRTYQHIPSQNHIPTILNIPISSTHQPLNPPHLTPSPHTPQSTPTNPNQPQPPQPQEECSTVYSQQCPPAYSAPRHKKHPNTFNNNQKFIPCVYTLSVKSPVR